jgi:hypothetical protein
VFLNFNINLITATLIKIVFCFLNILIISFIVLYFCFASPRFVLNITEKGAKLITASGVDERWRCTATSGSEQVCTPAEGKVWVVERMTISPLEVTMGVNEVLKYKI